MVPGLGGTKLGLHLGRREGRCNSSLAGNLGLWAAGKASGKGESGVRHAGMPCSSRRLRARWVRGSCSGQSQAQGRDTGMGWDTWRVVGSVMPRSNPGRPAQCGEGWLLPLCLILVNGSHEKRSDADGLPDGVSLAPSPCCIRMYLRLLHCIPSSSADLASPARRVRMES